MNSLGPPWPISAAVSDDGQVMIGGVGVSDVARALGTPAYLFDEADFRERCRRWRQALPDGEVYYAAKAFITGAVARIIDEEGLGLDVCSGGELAVARRSQFPPARMILHGNNKSDDEIRAAVAAGVGRIVVDSLAEIEQIDHVARERDVQVPVLLRIAPGVVADTHEAIATGHDDQKFGFPLSSGDARRAVDEILARPRLDLRGLHAHIGSEVAGDDGHGQSAALLVELIAEIYRETGVLLGELNAGGGLTIAYLPGEQDGDPAALVSVIRGEVVAAAAAAGIPAPHLSVEPGRSIVGPSMVTLYTVGAVKERSDGGAFVAVDGGMSDNPRVGLYGASYHVQLASRRSTAPDRTVTVAGRHCESGDVVVKGAALPADVARGDLIAVPASGAYHRSMASNYNLVPRPPVVTVRSGQFTLMVRRETTDDLTRLEVDG